MIALWVANVAPWFGVLVLGWEVCLLLRLFWFENIIGRAGPSPRWP